MVTHMKIWRRTKKDNRGVDKNFAKSTTQGSNGRPQLSLVAEKFKNFVFPLKSDSNFEKVEILFRVKILRVIPHWEVPPSWYQLWLWTCYLMFYGVLVGATPTLSVTSVIGAEAVSPHFCIKYRNRIHSSFVILYSIWRSSDLTLMGGAVLRVSMK